jgi:tRNA dimethylallyltransferase
MLAAGLEQEVKSLAGRYGWEAEPMKGIGYREWQAYFAGGQDLGQTRARIISATNNLAKRQRTWFKRNPDIQWFSSVEQAYDFARKTLSNHIMS